jgi:hypothetical protein
MLIVKWFLLSISDMYILCFSQITLSTTFLYCPDNTAYIVLYDVLHTQMQCVSRFFTLTFSFPVLPEDAAKMAI